MKKKKTLILKSKAKKNEHITPLRDWTSHCRTTHVYLWICNEPKIESFSTHLKRLEDIAQKQFTSSSSHRHFIYFSAYTRTHTHAHFHHINKTNYFSIIFGAPIFISKRQRKTKKKKVKRAAGFLSFQFEFIAFL